LYALVKKGASPVLDADVKITVENPEGHVMTVDLFDNGVGKKLSLVSCNSLCLPRVLCSSITSPFFQELYTEIL
jgi:hypothetical protein